MVFAVLLIAGFFAFRAVRPPVATPTPDPRATLAPVAVVTSRFFEIASGDYDFLAKVRNPNPGYGSPQVRYELTLEGTDGQQVIQQRGSFYILPGQVKYVLVSPIKTDAPAVRASMRITGIEWHQFDELALRGVDFVVTGTQFSSTPHGQVTAKVRGLVVNQSDFDISQVDVVVALLSRDGQPTAANRTEIRTFIAKTTRGFEAAWISPVAAPERIVVEANANLFNNDTFIRTYGTQEKFQQWY